MNEEPQSEAKRRKNRDGPAAFASMVVAVLAIALLVISII